MSDRPRILVMAHGHPDLSKGGGELAAHGLFQAYRDSDAVEATWFLACGALQPQGDGRLALYRPDEYLWDQTLAQPFGMKAANLSELTGTFAEFLRAIRPTVVHVHHYLHFGLEIFQIIKRTDPTIRVVLTLHEYLAICPNSGQMLKPDSDELCRSGHFLDHADCTRTRPIGDLWLRKHRFDHFFSFVDHFVAPSEFLRARYIEWGIAPDRITMLENGQPARSPLGARQTNGAGLRNRFGYFGQINPYKGLDVLLEAMAILQAEATEGIVLEVHGANLDRQPEDFQTRIADLLAPLMDAGLVHWHGPYDTADLAHRMAGVDWVVVPSIWYENSPLVIQEAYALGRPVVASNIGGMAEKVRDGETGVTVARGNPAAWAATLRNLARDPETWDRLAGNLPTPLSIEASAREHLALMATLEPEPA